MRFFLLALFLGLASASHFRYASISWEKHEGNEVVFSIATAWRRSYDGNYKAYHTNDNSYSKSTGTGFDGYPVTGDEIEVNGLEWPIFDTGDDTITYLSFKVVAYSTAEDWMYGHTTVRHTYKTPSNRGSPWVARFSGCCRLSNLHNNKDRTWNVMAHVNLMTEEYSPIVKSLPVISVPQNTEAEFYIPATNPNHERAIEWRLATSEELGGTSSHAAVNPEGLTVADAASGKMEFNTNNVEEGLYNAGVIVHSGNANTPVDFLIRVLPVGTDGGETGGDGNDAETIPTIQAIGYVTFPAQRVEYVGFKVEFDVKATDANTEDDVGFTWGPLPVGAHLSTVQQQAPETAGSGINPVVQTFTWVPCNDQQGFHIVCFEAVDQHGVASTQRCVHIQVMSDPAPFFLSSGPAADNYIGTVGDELRINAHCDDNNCKDHVEIDSDFAHPACRPEGSEWPLGAELAEQKPLEGEAIGVCNAQQRMFSWTPRWDQGGWNGDICFKCTDQAGGCEGVGEAVSTGKCVHVSIQRCRYMVQYEQQIQEIAAIYSTDWITLWQLNRNIEHPDYLLYSHYDSGENKEALYTGHVYKVNLRDNLYDIAARFGTTEAFLHYMNADLCEDNTIDVDQELCILPNACKGHVKSPYGQAGAKDNWYAGAKDAYHNKNGYQEQYVPGHQ